MSKLRAAVVGAGVISGVHFDAITNSEHAELVAICDVVPFQPPAGVDLQSVKIFDSYTELLQSNSVDVVHICTPHHLHQSMATLALEHGVHVVAEKPSGMNHQEAEELTTVVDQASAQYGVCFQNRYNRTSVALKELLDSGLLGTVHGASATVLWSRGIDYYDARPWRGKLKESGGGLLINQAIHTIDLLNWFLGDVVSVNGSVHTRQLPIEVEDTAEGVLTHESGVRTVFFATILNAKNDPPRISISTQNAEIDLDSELTIRWRDGRVETIQNEIARSGSKSYWGASHGLLIEDFYQHCRSGVPFTTGIAAGKAALDAVLMFYSDRKEQK